MIRNVLTDIDGIGLYGVISICLFFVVFAGMLVWAFSKKKNILDRQSVLPLEDGTNGGQMKGDSSYE
jgi:cbb3-type cytochrome oxidase subunit 3